MWSCTHCTTRPTAASRLGAPSMSWRHARRPAGCEGQRLIRKSRSAVKCGSQPARQPKRSVGQVGGTGTAFGSGSMMGTPCISQRITRSPSRRSSVASGASPVRSTVSSTPSGTTAIISLWWKGCTGLEKDQPALRKPPFSRGPVVQMYSSST